MIGAIIGDIVGSKYEFNNLRQKDFIFYTRDNHLTDDTVMTIAIADFHLDSIDKGVMNEKRVLQSLAKWYNKYPNESYGGGFLRWISGITEENITTYPYQRSYGNGSAMRISPIGDIGVNVQATMEYAELVTKCSHGHPEGIKGAQATALAIYHARNGAPKNYIRRGIEFTFGYYLGYDIDNLRKTYKFNETCQDTVPQAMACFLQSEDFEDAIRNAISIGGDSDTVAAITGGIAEAFYKDIPEWAIKGAIIRLPDDIKEVIGYWYSNYEISETYPKVSKKVLRLL